MSITDSRDAVLTMLNRIDKENRQWRLDVTTAIARSYMQSEHMPATSLPVVQIQRNLNKTDSDYLIAELLDRLHFFEIDLRFDRIVVAYNETFQWIFHTQPENSQWSDFTTWLQDDSNLYWVTGKPAAGKSTLMKFIYSDPRTVKYLKKWAAGRELIVSGFCFWNSGSELQMSQEGFVRTLLHKTLCQVPVLVPGVFPDRIEESIMFERAVEGDSPWTWKELLKALKSLVRDVTKTRNLFFWIDGLDEFNGNHVELVELIQSLCVPHVKICVSSRPWNVFEDGFRQRPSLRIEDLTYSDISHYVSSRFLRNYGFVQLQELDQEFADQLIQNIVVKSAGVFLWVTLVTDSLLEGLSDGERLDDLQRRLDTLPDDLETLFRKILSQMDDKHLKRSSQLLQIFRASLRSLTLLEFSYADEDDPELAFKVPLRPIIEQQAQARSSLMRRRLNACCKGLLEATSWGAQSLTDIPVEYLHRTVKDYLEQPEVWAKYVAVTEKSFSPYPRLCTASIARLKYSGSTIFDNEKSASTFWNIVTCAIEYVVHDAHATNGLQNRLLDELDIAASYCADLKDYRGLTFLEQWRSGWGLEAKHWTATRVGCKANRSFLDLAVQCQLMDYVESRVSSFQRKISRDDISYALFISVSQYRSFEEDLRFLITPSIVHKRPNLQLVQVLLKHGADPNAHINPDESPWTRALEQSVISNETEWDNIYQLFLEYGADPKTMLNYEYRNNQNSKLTKLARKKNIEAKWTRFTNLFHK
jgi:NACHT domain